MRFKIWYNLTLLLLFLFCSNLWGQKANQDFSFVNIKEGISKVGIYSINQDHYGFIWICTNGSGLYKFDGINYTSYKYNTDDPSSLSSNLVFTSYIDKSNRLWIGTDEGLNLYNRNLDKFEKISVGNFGETSISVLSLHEDTEGSLYIGTRQLGLLKMNLNTSEITSVSDRRSGSVPAINSIKSNEEGTIFLGTSVGLRLVDTETNQIVLPRINIEMSTIDIAAPIQSLHFENNNLWAGTYDVGLYKYRFKEESIVGFYNYKISNRRILAISQLPDQTLLVGSENDGLFHMSNTGDIINNYLYKKTEIGRAHV